MKQNLYKNVLCNLEKYMNQKEERDESLYVFTLTCPPEEKESRRLRIISRN